MNVAQIIAADIAHIEARLGRELAAETADMVADFWRHGLADGTVRSGVA